MLPTFLLKILHIFHHCLKALDTWPFESLRNYQCELK